MAPRERWGSRVGLILAAAGNAVGIGNLLRFPAQAGANGGGAFMIPYFIALLLLGIPLMWVLWTIGRLGGQHGHGSAPGILSLLWPHPLAKYLGALGIAIPLVFILYYTYVEGWCLAYAWFSLTGDYQDGPGRAVDLQIYLAEFQNTTNSANYFPGLNTAMVFLLLTVVLNVWVLYRGVAKGIEAVAKIAMPLLLLFCVIMAVRVFTLPAQQGTVWDGLSFLFTPNFSALANPTVWLAAAGQIFFTLSIGFGSIECFGSYLRKDDDVTLTGLTTASTNEFVEVLFGSMIAIPAAAVFFGAAQVQTIAQSGTYNIGMVAMPEILRAYAGVGLFGTAWFLLLFFAAFTSSVAAAQPVIAFLTDETQLDRRLAALLVGLIWIFGSVFMAFFYRYGVLTEADFWAGTLGLVVFSAIEVILFAWCFGIERGWREMHRGADLQVPRVYRYVIQYVTPLLLLAILGGWIWQNVIRGDGLRPRPVISQTVVDRKLLPGRILYRPPAGAAAQAEHERIQRELRELIQRERRDLTIWAQVELGETGEVVVAEVEGAPPLERLLPPARLARYLALSGMRYEVDGRPRSGALQLALEGYYTASHIWLVRVMMLVFLMSVVLMIRVLWEKRGRREQRG